MKLRIRGNSLRLRVTRSEVEKIRLGEPVSETISFSPAHRLEYLLERCPGTAGISAAFSEGRIRVAIPEAEALTWAGGPGISLTAEQPIPGSSGLKILVEKDFSCLHPADGADEGDFFERPEA